MSKTKSEEFDLMREFDLGDFWGPTLINENLNSLREEMCQNSLTIHKVTAQKKEWKPLRDSFIVASC